MCRCNPKNKADWCPSCPPLGHASLLSADEALALQVELHAVLGAVKTELDTACTAWPAMNSAHEGYGVLLEEVDELWEHVKTKQKNRDLDAMRKEAIQVAAMAVRFAIEVCNEKRGRK